MLLRLLKTVLLWLIPLFMVSATLWLQTPLLYKIRWPLMLIIGLAHLLQRFQLPSLFWSAGQASWQIRARGVLCGGACLIALGGAVHQTTLRWRVMRLAPEQLQRVGAHLMVGYTDFEEIKQLAALGAVAGVFVTTRNLEAGGYHQLQAELAQLQQLRRERDQWVRYRVAQAGVQSDTAVEGLGGFVSALKVQHHSWQAR